MVNGKSTVSILDRAKKVYSPKKASRAANNNQLGNEESNVPSKSSLEPLEFLDDLFEQPNISNEEEGASTKSNLNANGTSMSNHPLMTLDDENDKTPAWNHNHAVPYDPAAYGLKLDTTEFEEENLFDNFKSIFDYSQPIPPNYDNSNDDDREPLYNSDSNNQGPQVRFVTEVEQTLDMLLN